MKRKIAFVLHPHLRLLRYPSYIRGTKGVTKQNHNSPNPSYLKMGIKRALPLIHPVKDGVKINLRKEVGRIFILWMVMLLLLNACGPHIMLRDIGGEDFKGVNAQPLTYDPESHWIRQTQDKITVMIRYLASGRLMDRPTANYPPAFEIGVINESGDPIAINNYFIYLSDGSKPLPEVDITPPFERTDFCTFFHANSDNLSNPTDCDMMNPVVTVIGLGVGVLSGSNNMGIIIIGSVLLTPVFMAIGWELPLVYGSIVCPLYDIPKCEHIYHKNRDIFNQRVQSMNNLLLQDGVIQPNNTADGWVFFNSLPSSGTLTISLRDTKTNALKTFVFNL